MDTHTPLLVLLGIELSTFHFLGKHSTPEPQPQPQISEHLEDYYINIPPTPCMGFVLFPVCSICLVTPASLMSLWMV